MNRTSRGRSRAVVREGTREPNVRPTTPLNRLLGFAAGVGRAALGGSFGERQRLLGWPTSAAHARLGACVGRASTQDPDEPEITRVCGRNIPDSFGSPFSLSLPGLTADNASL